MRIQGFATGEGTGKFKNRFAGEKSPQSLHPDHFKQSQGLWFSSLGFGTYLGEPDPETDALYKESAKEALRCGINVIDSAINYRCQRSERCLGEALRELIEAGEIQREEILICTKGGFLPFEGEYPADPLRYFHQTYVDSGILRSEEIVQGCHAMTPRYLEDQLEKSRSNLGVETIDIYYVHNPETQLAERDRKEFTRQLETVFEWLEKKVAEGKIRMYGTATWSGYRVRPESPDFLSLEDIDVLAREAGGPHHHFCAVQLPFNVAMPEAWIFPNQRYGGRVVSLLEAAEKLGILVVASASLLQGQLARPFPPDFQDFFHPLKKSAQCSLQFARSCSGVVTALAGMKQKGHVRENSEVAKFPRLKESELAGLFRKAR